MNKKPIVWEFDGIGSAKTEIVNVINDHNMSDVLRAEGGRYGVSLSYGKHGIETNSKQWHQ